MATTTFTNGVTLTDEEWFNHVDTITYDGATTQILVGGGAGTIAAWTTATGSGSPVRGTSPAFTTSITTASTTFTALAGATTLLTIGGTGATAVFAIPGTLEASGTTGALTVAGGVYVAKATNAIGLVTGSAGLLAITGGSNPDGTVTGVKAYVPGAGQAAICFTDSTQSSGNRNIDTYFNGGVLTFRAAADDYSSATDRVRFAMQTGNVTLATGQLIIATTTSPTGAGTGTTGQIAWDTSYLYVCTATNDWRRVALVDF